jgi:hypothetical protein
MNENKLNGYTQLFRIITPIMTTVLTVLVTINIFILTWLRNDMRELKTHFGNHLSEHKQIEITIEKRFSCLEVLLNEYIIKMYR